MDFGPPEKWEYFIIFVNENGKKTRFETNDQSLAEEELNELYKKYQDSKVEIIDHNLSILTHLTEQGRMMARWYCTGADF